jgi:hypothetical protein
VKFGVVGILATDAWIFSEKEKRDFSVQLAIKRYVAAGGTFVSCGLVPSEVKREDIGSYFRKEWAVPWRGGDGYAPASRERDTDFTNRELRGLEGKIVMFASRLWDSSMNDMAYTSEDYDPLMLESPVGTSVAEKAGKVSKCKKSRIREEDGMLL